MTTPPSPVCFISYSHDSEEHKTWVRNLAEELTRFGVTVLLDEWDARLGMDLTQYMETSVRDSNYVLAVCTPNYAARANERKGGVGYETAVVSGEVYQQADPRKFIPVLRTGTAETALPSYLKARLYVDLSDDSKSGAQLERLIRHLFDSPKHVRPSLGKPPDYVRPEAQGRSGKERVKPPKSLERIDALITEKQETFRRVAAALQQSRTAGPSPALGSRADAVSRLSNEIAELQKLRQRTTANNGT